MIIENTWLNVNIDIINSVHPILLYVQILDVNTFVTAYFGIEDKCCGFEFEDLGPLLTLRAKLIGIIFKLKHHKV